jgi:hypothetical protein
MIKRRAHRRLKEEEFANATRGLRIQKANLELARMVMVDGVRVTDLAEAKGVTYQRVSATVRRIYEAHLRQVDYPSDWQQITVTVPEPMAKEIQAMADKATATMQRERQLQQVIQGVSHATLDEREE